jgi:hypothetical protein
MYDAGGKHFYVDEIASTEDGYVIPLQWFEDDNGMVGRRSGRLWVLIKRWVTAFFEADGRRLSSHAKQSKVIFLDEGSINVELIEATSLKVNVLDLQDKIPGWPRSSTLIGTW